MNVVDIPFNKFIGIKESSRGDYLLELNYLPEYKNHLNAIHASAQFALAEATSGKYLLEKFKEYRDKMLAVVRRVEIKYSKACESRIFSTAIIKNIDEIIMWLKTKNRIFININVELFDENKNSISQSVFEWYIQKIKDKI